MTELNIIERVQRLNEEKSENQPLNKTTRILVLDDEEMILDAVEFFLQDNGYELHLANCAAEAFAILEKFEIDVFVTDIALPDIEFPVLINEISRKYPEIVSIVMTGNPTFETAALSIKSRVLEYLVKPFSKNQIVVAVAKALRWRMQRSEEKSVEIKYSEVKNKMENILQEKAKEIEFLNFLVLYDSVTALPNDRYFNMQVGLHMKGDEGEEQRFSLIVLEIDKFRVIVERFGQSFIDQICFEISSRIAESLPSEAFLARISDDRFGILSVSLSTEKKIQEFSGRLIQRLTHPFHIENDEITLAYNIGAIVYPDAQLNAESLIGSLEVSIESAKSSGTNRCVVFQQGMDKKMMRKHFIETALGHAMKENEFTLFFQPKVNIRTKKISGAEALLRWTQDGVSFSPAEFIPIAEDTGMIIPIGKWVIRKACEQIARWQNAFPEPVPIAVNLSARQFQQSDLVEFIGESIREAGIPANLLEIEITESTAVTSSLKNLEVFRILNDMGVTISIDDFGTGYSSFSYLMKFPFRTMKIDRSFFQNVPGNEQEENIVIGIIAFAKSLKLKVVAEGIETNEQLEFLKRTDCDEMQGYLYGKPESAEVFEVFYLK